MVDKRFIVCYVRIVEDKEDGLKYQYSGPFIGPIRDTEEEAERAAKELTNDPKDPKQGTIIPQVVELYRSDVADAIERSKEYFNKIEGHMKESEEIMRRPIRRKKK